MCLEIVQELIDKYNKIVEDRFKEKETELTSIQFFSFGIIYNGDIMLINNRFSNKNKLIYKMKYLNTRDSEYTNNDNIDYLRIEKYNDIVKK